MNKLVKITHDEDGEKIDGPKWCFIVAERTLCSGQVFGEGEGNAKFELKEKEKGGVTCPDCLQLIKDIKSIKL